MTDSRPVPKRARMYVARKALHEFSEDECTDLAAALTYYSLLALFPAATTSDHEIAIHMNEAMREGRYSPDLWKEYTGKTVDELWADYIETLKKP